MAIQRIVVSGRVQVGYRVVDGGLEAVEVGEGSMRRVARSQDAPNDLDIVQLRRVFGSIRVRVRMGFAVTG